MADERFQSVWDALGENPSETSLFKTKAALMRAIQRRISDSGWTQSETAKRLGVHQPRVSDLMRGQLSGFSLDALYSIAETLGLNPELRWSTAV